MSWEHLQHPKTVEQCVTVLHMLTLTPRLCIMISVPQAPESSIKSILRVLLPVSLLPLSAELSLLLPLLLPLPEKLSSNRTSMWGKLEICGRSTRGSQIQHTYTFHHMVS